MKLGWILPSIFIAAACSHEMPKTEAPPVPAPVAPNTIEEAVNNPERSVTNRARDQYRHPVETLRFFDVRPDQTVVEILPGAGWYTEIIAPFVAPHGHLYLASRPSGDAENQKLSTSLKAWMDAHPEIAQRVTVTEFDPPKQVEIAPPGTVDRVLTFRNLHNWMMKKNEKAAFKAFFRALKPGGILGIVEHRADPKKPQVEGAKNGYVRQDVVVQLAKEAGFKLADQSEINANPKDTKDYAEGVWTLPPTYRLGEQDHDKYAAIGESDRMTLKFVRPFPSKKKGH